MTTDLTVGKPSQKLFWFSIPLLLSVAFQQLYQMADSIIVGRFAETVEAGELALAAVGASYPITQLFVAVATGINIGTGVLVSQLFGAKRYLRMKTAISTALLTTTTVALLLTLIGAIGTHGIMNALSTPENIFADGSLYLRVYVFGLLFLFIYNVCTGIFNAMGDSRTPLILLVLSSVGNVILDMVFVAGLHWGVAGVAWATFIAQGASGVLAFVLLLRRVRSFDTGHHFVLFAPEMLRRLTNYAVPSIAQQSFVSVGNVRHSVLHQPVRRDRHCGLLGGKPRQPVCADLLHVVRVRSVTAMLRRISAPASWTASVRVSNGVRCIHSACPWCLWRFICRLRTRLSACSFRRAVPPALLMSHEAICSRSYRSIWSYAPSSCATACCAVPVQCVRSW